MGQVAAREEYFPSVGEQDIGIDLIAHRRSDGRPIAVQCKARKLEPDGSGNEIGKNEIAKFSAVAANELFAERWLVTNGANPSTPTPRALSKSAATPSRSSTSPPTSPPKQPPSRRPTDDDCPHCSDPEATRHERACNATR